MEKYMNPSLDLKLAERLFRADIARVESLDLGDKWRNAREYRNALTSNLNMIAERAGCLIDGNYGYGAYGIFHSLADTDSRALWVLVYLGVLEWHGGERQIRFTWRKCLTPAERATAITRITEVISRKFI